MDFHNKKCIFTHFHNFRQYQHSKNQKLSKNICWELILIWIWFYIYTLKHYMKRISQKNIFVTMKIATFLDWIVTMIWDCVIITQHQVVFAANSHSLHGYLTPSCLLSLWCLSILTVVAANSHLLHRCIFSLCMIFLWCLRLLADIVAYSHSSQGYGSSNCVLSLSKQNKRI